MENGIAEMDVLCCVCRQHPRFGLLHQRLVCTVVHFTLVEFFFCFVQNPDAADLRLLDSHLATVPLSYSILHYIDGE
jgi:hypothetical protein